MGRRFLCHSSLSRMKTSLEDAYQWVPQFLIWISKILSPTPQQKHWSRNRATVARTSTHSLDGQKNSSKSDHRRILPLLASFLRGFCREISFFADDNNSRYAPIDRDTAAAAIKRGHSSPRDTRRDDVRQLSRDLWEHIISYQAKKVAGTHDNYNYLTAYMHAVCRFKCNNYFAHLYRTSPPRSLTCHPPIRGWWDIKFIFKICILF